MSYSVTCACGAIHAVSATQAGSTFPCRCGRLVNVPRLSALRAAAGETPVPRNVLETIRAMVRDGLLPSGAVCPYSGRPANDTLEVRVQCERSWVRGGEPMSLGTVVALILFFGWLGHLLASLKPRPREELGRDTWIRIPLRISADVRSKLLRTRRQKTWQQILRATPIYAQLLDEFPGATISPVQPR